MFQFNVDPTNPEQVRLAIASLSALLGEEPKELPVESETVAPAEKKKPAAKKPAKKEEAESSVTIAEIRTLIKDKVGDNRDAIKKKLSELGAKSATALKAENYDAFHKFLTEL